MYPYIKKIINLTQLCISKYGFKHQCTDHSTYSPNKFLENKTAHLRDYAKSLLLSHISGGQPVQLDNEEEGFNKLLSVMELLKEGRIQTAIADITPYWTTADCDTILQHGIATHVKQRELPEKGLQALVKRFACLVRSGIHQRFGAIDLAQDSIPNVRTVHHTEVDPARPIWDDALYDPVALIMNLYPMKSIIV
ncbi:hypothetical protein BC939DRAFT_478732 [Gamsiella multidivaricata]|uniref:uncharacterized protein n=1 Tax=Gamsiella multidivaricata TaxID=101098 RepID=UPI00221EFFE5|nr:uncharacterized protein BC939DRAFT_478732 [Gamsiella multidivaricata]KAI7820864.1 hypothetical protein BC939DRAFT_478732 [Gamsiella multidivaricata]